MKKQRHVLPSSLLLTIMALSLGAGVLLVEFYASQQFASSLSIKVENAPERDDETTEDHSELFDSSDAPANPAEVIYPTRPPQSNDAELESALTKIKKQLASGKNRSALTAAKSLAENYPKEPRVHFFLGLAHARNENSESAIRAYQTALKSFPDYLSALFNLGSLYQQNDQPDSAIFHLNRCLELTAEKDLRAKAYAVRGHCYRELKDRENSVNDYKNSLILRPQSLSTWRYMALAYLQEPYEWESSLAAIEQALKLNPEYVRGLIFKGILFRQKGAFEDAVRQFEAALEIDPENEEALWEQALIQWEFGNLVAAIKRFRRLLEVTESSGRHHAYEAMIALSEQNYSRAWELGERIHGSRSLRRLRLFIHANTSLKRADFQQAKHPLELLLEDDPNDVYLLKAYGETLLALELAEAKTVLAKLVEISPENPLAWRLQGAFYQQIGHLDAAQKSYSKAVAQSDRIDILQDYAACLIEANQFETAEKVVIELLQREPKDVKSILLKSRVTRVQGNLDTARKELTALDGSDAENVAVLTETAALYEDEGKFAQAAELISNAVSLMPESISLRIRKVQLLNQAAQYKTAIAEAQTILSLDSNNEEALRLLSILSNQMPEGATNVEH